METKTCQNCKNSFVIEPEDFSFYKKINVPAPTWCPECRMIRRMAFRDYRVLYKRTCDQTKKDIFSIFPKNSQFKVYDRDVWWSDVWDSSDYARDYDFSRPFFEQLKELFLAIPCASRSCWDMINSDYCTGANSLKNCYLVFVSTHSEDSLYSAEINNTKNSIDVTRIESSELCYQSFTLNKCYRTFFSSHSENCMDIWFSRDLSNCNFCFGCSGLRNKKYYIFNKQYSPEEYEKKISDFGLGSYESLMKTKKEAENFTKKQIRRFTEGRYNTNVSGEYINNSKNVKSSYYINQAEDSKYLQCFFTPSTRSCYDCTLWGENSELCYECSSAGADNYNVKFSYRCTKNTRDCEYSSTCFGCSNIFACAGLRNKQYCIFNKQYSKEEYLALKEKIIQHMDQMPYVDQRGVIYKYGEFLPPSFGLFAYNESLAQDYFPLTKEEALAQGYRWQDPEKRNYRIDILNKDIPDEINRVDKSIINKVLECEHQEKCTDNCTGAYKIVEAEFNFYKKMNLPLPRLCPNCRHVQRIQMRNGIKLYHRKCMKAGCNNEFETSYAPDRPEIVYCESCYNKEIY